MKKTNQKVSSAVAPKSTKVAAINPMVQPGATSTQSQGPSAQPSTSRGKALPVKKNEERMEDLKRWREEKNKKMEEEKKNKLKPFTAGKFKPPATFVPPPPPQIKKNKKPVMKQVQKRRSRSAPSPSRQPKGPVTKDPRFTNIQNRMQQIEKKLTSKISEGTSQDKIEKTVKETRQQIANATQSFENFVEEHAEGATGGGEDRPLTQADMKCYCDIMTIKLLELESKMKELQLEAQRSKQQVTQPQPGPSRLEAILEKALKPFRGKDKPGPSKE